MQLSNLAISLYVLFIVPIIFDAMLTIRYVTIPCRLVHGENARLRCIGRHCIDVEMGALVPVRGWVGGYLVSQACTGGYSHSVESRIA